MFHDALVPFAERRTISMRIAYLITTYVEPIQLARLIKALMTPQTDFYIHIDKKVPMDEFVKAIDEIRNDSHIRFIDDKQRVAVSWGGYSQVNSQKLLIQECINSGINYDWCINITGTDYPVWSNKRIQEYFSSRTMPVIKGYELNRLNHGEKEEGTRDRIRKYWLFDITPVIVGKVVRKSLSTIQDILKIRRNLDLQNCKWRFGYGSEYWAIPFPMIKKILQYYEQDKELQKILKTSFVPSEFWIHTVLLSSDILSEKEKETIIFPGDKYDGLGSVALLHYFVYTSAGIKVLTLEDYENIQKSDKIFIRKVRTGISDELIANINQERNYVINS